MIITVEEAQKKYPDVQKEDLEGIEQSIRQLTNNNFQNKHIRAFNLAFNGNTITTSDDLFAFREGQTIQVSESEYSDGLYVIEKIDKEKGIVTVDNDIPFFDYHLETAFMTAVEYPPDILYGVFKLLEYQNKMSDKIGVKSITVARMTESYYDVTASESTNGFPRTLMNFIDKYKRIRWS